MAPMSAGFTSGTRSSMSLAAVVAMVTVSSSGEGTDFWKIIRPFPMAAPSAPHTLPISSGLILYLGTYAP